MVKLGFSFQYCLLVQENVTVRWDVGLNKKHIAYFHNKVKACLSLEDVLIT